MHPLRYQGIVRRTDALAWEATRHDALVALRMHREEQLRLALASVPSRSWHAAGQPGIGSVRLPMVMLVARAAGAGEGRVAA